MEESVLATCHDCVVEEGQLHELGCDMERCPFCGNQLITCGCCYEILDLRDPTRYSSRTSHLPPEVYTNGLSAAQGQRWLLMLEDKGRVPWIQYPCVCVRCGKLWPNFFSVTDKEWQGYIELSRRDSLLCRSCYDCIKGAIDSNREVEGGVVVDV